jgi:hypothetical protein
MAFVLLTLRTGGISMRLTGSKVRISLVVVWAVLAQVAWYLWVELASSR